MKNIVKNTAVILIMILSVTLIGCTQRTTGTASEKMTVAVSIVPQQTFVKAIAGDLINIVTVVPPGNSPANYAPTPREMEAYHQASLYFTIGAPTEEANILPKAKAINENIRIISLAEEVGNVYPHRYFGKEHGHEEDKHEHGAEEHEHEEDKHKPIKQKTTPNNVENNIIFFKSYVDCLAIAGGTDNSAIIKIIPTTLIKTTMVSEISIKSTYSSNTVRIPRTVVNSSSNKYALK